MSIIEALIKLTGFKTSVELQKCSYSQCIDLATGSNSLTTSDPDQ